MLLLVLLTLLCSPQISYQVALSNNKHSLLCRDTSPNYNRHVTRPALLWRMWVIYTLLPAENSRTDFLSSFFVGVKIDFCSASKWWGDLTWSLSILLGNAQQEPGPVARYRDRKCHHGLFLIELFCKLFVMSLVKQFIRTAGTVYHTQQHTSSSRILKDFLTGKPISEMTFSAGVVQVKISVSKWSEGW